MELEDKVARAEVIDVSKLSGSVIKFGATVTLADEETDEEQTYQIVGEDEADISNGRLSVTSPLGARADRQGQRRQRRGLDAARHQILRGRPGRLRLSRRRAPAAARSPHALASRPSSPCASPDRSRLLPCGHPGTSFRFRRGSADPFPSAREAFRAPVLTGHGSEVRPGGNHGNRKRTRDRAAQPHSRKRTRRRDPLHALFVSGLRL